MRYAINQSKNSIQDSDIVMLAISCCNLMAENRATNILVVFGVGKHHTGYNIGRLIETIDKRNAQGFPYFHSITGCDTSSRFFKQINVSCVTPG